MAIECALFLDMPSSVSKIDGKGEGSIYKLCFQSKNNTGSAVCSRMKVLSLRHLYFLMNIALLLIYNCFWKGS